MMLQKIAGAQVESDSPGEKIRFKKKEIEDTFKIAIHSPLSCYRENPTIFDEIKITSSSSKLESSRVKKIKDEIRECVIF
jgi:uncharacterized protein YpbB